MKEIIKEWLDKADDDLTLCKELLAKKRVLSDIVAFHAQQAAEKYLKALWEYSDIDIIKRMIYIS